MAFIPAVVTEDYNKRLITLDRERRVSKIATGRNVNGWMGAKYSLIPLLRMRCTALWQASSEPKRCPDWVLCHEHRRSTRRCATVLEMKEGPSGSVIRSPIPSHRERLWPKAMVVSVAETSGR